MSDTIDCSATAGTTELLSTALGHPMGLAFNSDESRLYAADAGNATSPTRVMVFAVSSDGVVVYGMRWPYRAQFNCNVCTQDRYVTRTTQKCSISSRMLTARAPTSIASRHARHLLVD